MRVKSIPQLLIVITLLSSVLLPSSARTQQRGVGVTQAPTAGAGRYFALVIGNDEYRSLPKLKTAAADAREVERMLRESYGFQTKLLVNSTRVQIVAALSAYRRELTADDNLVIYYAGHGYNDKDADKAYWLPVDATGDDNSNWIIADEITTGIRVIPARHVLVVSDSCYSGTLTRGLSLASPPPAEREQFLQKMTAGHSRTLMASGGDEPVADSGGGGHSVFAAALLNGLQKMDKVRFTAGELFSNYIIESVAGRAEQTPLYDPLRNSGHESGDFVFVRIKTPDGKTVEVTVKTPPATVDPAAFELSYWNSIQNSTDVEDFKDYLSKYPTGQFASIARRRVATLTGPAKPAANPTPAGNTKLPAPTSTPGTATGAILGAVNSNDKPASTDASPDCFANHPGAGVTDRASHASWAQGRGAGELASNLQRKLDELYACPAMSDEKLADAFGKISVIVARYVPDADCFGGDAGVVGTDAAAHRSWAVRMGRQKSLGNLKGKVAAALNCLSDANHAELFADVSVVIAQAAAGR